MKDSGGDSTTEDDLKIDTEGRLVISKDVSKEEAFLPVAPPTLKGLESQATLQDTGTVILAWTSSTKLAVQVTTTVSPSCKRATFTSTVVSEPALPFVTAGPVPTVFTTTLPTVKARLLSSKEDIVKSHAGCFELLVWLTVAVYEIRSLASPELLSCVKAICKKGSCAVTEPDPDKKEFDKPHVVCSATVREEPCTVVGSFVSRQVSVTSASSPSLFWLSGALVTVPKSTTTRSERESPLGSDTVIWLTLELLKLEPNV